MRFFVVGVAVLAILTGVLWMWRGHLKAPAHFSGQPSMPVNGTVDANSIRFETETLESDLSGENYFVNYRLQREQFRQESKSMLAELLDSNVVKSKEQAQAKWLELSTKIEKEGEIENLLKIKGFQDAVADVNPESVTVIIYADHLAAGEVSSIQDIVVRVTKVRLDKITISAKA